MAVRPDDSARFVQATRDLPNRDAVVAFATRVLDAVADARSAARSAEVASAIAEELGISKDLAVEGIRLRSALERGCDSPEEWHAVLAAYGLGLGPSLESREAAARARKAVVRLDALEALGADAYRGVEAALSAVAIETLLAALVDQTIEDDGRGRSGRARAYARVEFLTTSQADAAVAARARLARRLSPSPLADVLRRGVGDGAVTVRGELVSRPRGGFLSFLALVTGVRALAWVLRGLARLASARHEVTLTIDDEGLKVTEAHVLRGLVVRSREARYVRAAMIGDACEIAYRALPLYLGSFTFASGVALGTYFVGDGVRSGETFLLALGAGLAGIGALVDLLFTFLVPRLGHRRTLCLVLAPGRELVVAGVPEADTERALAALAKLRR